MLDLSHIIKFGKVVPFDMKGIQFGEAHASPAFSFYDSLKNKTFRFMIEDR